MIQSKPYVFRPLDQSRREIRLIELLNLDELLSVTEAIESDPILHRDPDIVRSIEDDIPIRCAISHVSLDDKPVYVAFSYTVGDILEALFSFLWTFHSYCGSQNLLDFAIPAAMQKRSMLT